MFMLMVIGIPIILGILAALVGWFFGHLAIGIITGVVVAAALYGLAYLFFKNLFWR